MKFMTLLLLTLSVSDAHIKMREPNNGGLDMSPVKKICGGARGISKAVSAGSSLRVVLEGTASHEGGGCQFGVSYDDAKTFTLLMTTEASCPIVQKFDVPIPSNAPACEKCVFAWGWIPKLSGGPEYYMNCAEVKIESNVTGSSLEGPKMQFFNLPGYPTVHVDNKDKSATIGLTERFGVFVLAKNSSAPPPNTSTKIGTTSSFTANPSTTSLVSKISVATSASIMSPSSSSTSQSAMATSKPVTYIDQRTLFFSKAASSTSQSASATSKPVTYIDQRTLFFSKAASSTSQSASATSEPVTYIDQRTLFLTATSTLSPSSSASSSPSEIGIVNNNGNTSLKMLQTPQVASIATGNSGSITLLICSLNIHLLLRSVC
jgi:hypothetical protein